jgi:hypothetical protein
MNYNRPSFRDSSRAYESIDGSDLPREFWGTPRFSRRRSKAELRHEADEAFREFKKRDSFLKLIKEAAMEIVIKDARISWGWGSILDPYGIFPSSPHDNVGRLYFAFAPISKVWICFYDLPRPVVDALWRAIKAGQLTFNDDD